MPKLNKTDAMLLARRKANPEEEIVVLMPGGKAMRVLKASQVTVHPSPKKISANKPC